MWTKYPRDATSDGNKENAGCMSRPWRIFGNLASTLSSVPPLIYLVAYLSAIPAFAAVYFAMPPGFYAPYARLEYTGQSDAYDAGILIQTAIRRTLQERSSLFPVMVQNLRVREDLTYVQRFLSPDGSSVTFDLLVMLWDDTNKYNIQVVIPILMRGSSRVLMTANRDSRERFFRAVELNGPEQIPSDPQSLAGDTFREALRPMDAIFSVPSVELTREEEEKLSQFFEGLKGNATAVSGAYGRMLYFSSMVITTVGFGDIVPITTLARSLVAIEAVLGISFAGLFLNAVAYRAARRVQ
jgi:hypothetical protein